MSSPLPLRLWCMATMAPALTAEAATQARVKLAPGSPNGDTSPIVNGRDHIANPGETDLLTRRSPVDQSSNKPQITLASHIHKNLDTRTLNLAHQNRIIKLALGTNRNNNHHNHYLSSRLSEGKVSTNGDIAMENGDKMTHSKIIKTISVTTANGKNGLQRATNGNSKPVTSNVILQNSKVPKITNLNSDLNAVNVNNVNNNASESSTDGSDQPVNNSLTGNDRDSQITSNSTGSSRPENNSDSSHRQQHLEKRATRLLKRLRRLQTHQAVSHTRQQMMGFVTTQHRNLQSIANSNRLPDTSLLPPTDLKTELLQSEDVKNLSTASLVNLVRRLQASQITLRQRLSSNSNDARSVLTLDEELCDDIDGTAGNLSMNLRHVESAADSDATESSSGGESCDEMDWEECEPKHQPPLHRRAEWKWASERSSIASRWTWLQAQVSDLEYRIRQQNDIYRQIRAAKGQVVLGDTPPPEDLMVRYRPSRTGGKKLSPIEAKIADIEKRNEMSPCNLSTLLNNIDKQSSKLTQSLGNCYSPVQASPLATSASSSASAAAATATTTTSGIAASSSSLSSSLSGKHSPVKPNGALEPSGSETATTSEAESDINSKKITQGEPSTPLVGLNTPSPVIGSPNLDATCQAARCRPVKSYRKRKLLRTYGVHHLNRKAARLATVTCHCHPPTTSCSLCGGRYNNVQQVDQYTMPVPERVALLDHSYHSVLSFSHDVPLTAHFDTLLKSGDWQSKPSSRALKTVQTEKRKLKLTKESNGKHGKRLSKSATAALLHSNLRHKFADGKKLSRGRSGSLPSTPRSKLDDGRMCRTEIKRRKAASLALALKKQRALSLPNRFKTLTPSPTPLDPGAAAGSISQSCPASSLKEMKDSMRKRRGESAFDINNIVIPYSMAASTRVEKLKYKEILTPRWRDLSQEKKEEATGKVEEETPESDEAVTAKTSRTDQEEASQGTKEQKEEADSEDRTAAGTESGNGAENGTGARPDLGVGGEEDEEIEDLTDETFAVRHMKCEVAEKKRFLSFVPTNKRTGSLNRSLSRPDSMASLTRTESGATTPDPISPDTSMNDSLFGSMNVSSPATATPSPLTLSGPPGLGGSTEKDNRSGSLSAKLLGDDGMMVPRRSGSFSRKDRLSALSTGSDNADRSTTASPVEERPVVMPWLPREFPISESEYEIMVEEHEAVKLEKHVTNTSGMALRAHSASSSLDGATVEDLVDPVVAEASSPLDGSPLGSVDGDDPNDPEWTVAPKLQKPGIVLKLSKR